MAFLHAIQELRAGRMVTIQPKGRSMHPRVKDGQRVLLAPYGSHLAEAPPAVGDVVLTKVKGSVYLHKILAIDGERVQIGNERGHVNGWTTTVYGKAILKGKAKRAT